MLLFVQFLQVSRAMTTYENMFGIDNRSAASLTSAFTSTGAPLDPSQPAPLLEETLAVLVAVAMTTYENMFGIDKIGRAHV